ncbi:hypothetical protein [Hymenobacter ruricola]|uniref:Uncharacterized protein n=1 Tax=Hymenobacter ruricola TaxID=2791023 RepID=A0ABS0IBL4_9BACT|nr:hypothetical protein [Hymenobacter ruricola]MBF9224373.1 hypothetical protein [Hymenobacter ruricola]
MEIFINSTITAFLLLVSGLWLKNYLPNYFNEKGKLLAQKEDIAEITEKIESVKSDFSKDTERLKTDLQRILNYQLSHRNEERASIIAFYDKYNQWLYSLLEINFGGYSRSNLKDLTDKRTFIENFYAEANIAQAKLNLIVKSDEIITLSHDLIMQVLKFKHWMDARLLTLQQNIESHQSLSERFLIIIKDYDANKALAEAMAKDEENLMQKAKEIKEEFYANRNEEYKKLLPTNSAFTKTVKEYLTN